jgi:hypothetical protein
LYENDSQTDIVAETDSQIHSQSDSQTESQTDSQTDSTTDSQTESAIEVDSETDLQTDSQADLQTDVECETITYPAVSQTDIEPGTSTQTDSQTDTDLSYVPPAKRLHTDSGNVLYEVSDHRSSQQEIVSEDDFAILHDLLTDGTTDQTDEVTLQPTTSAKHDKIR